MSRLSNEKEPLLVTKEGLKKLKDELKHLETIGRQEMADELGESVSQGDLRESFDYAEAKRRQGFLEGRIIELKNKIDRAQIATRDKDSNKIQIGSKITVLFDNQEEEYEITGISEADPLQNKIAYNSAFGEQLVGLSQGDKFKLKAPKGPIEVRILKIE